MTRPRRLAAVVLASVLLAPATAFGQDPGVTVDPDSPSGREYEIPLESARRGAEPGRDPGAPVNQTERDAPLFGAGIGDSDASSDPGSGSGGARKPSSESSGGDTRKPSDPPASDPERTLPPAAVRAAAANPGAPGGDAGTIALIVAGGAIVLGIGGGAGLIARRRAR